LLQQLEESRRREAELQHELGVYRDGGRHQIAELVGGLTASDQAQLIAELLRRPLFAGAPAWSKGLYGMAAPWMVGTAVLCVAPWRPALPPQTPWAPTTKLTASPRLAMQACCREVAAVRVCHKATARQHGQSGRIGEGTKACHQQLIRLHLEAWGRPLKS